MSKSMMKAIAFNPTTNSLEISHVPTPTPKDDEVLVRIKAFSLDRVDLHPFYSRPSNRGDSSEEDCYQHQRQIPGTEAVGVIVSPTTLSHSSGDNSDKELPAVLILQPSLGDRRSIYAEYMTLPKTRLQHIRTSLPWEILAAMPNAFYIAWGALIRVLGLRPKERILVRGAEGEIGRAAVAVARSHGAWVVGVITDSSKENADEDGMGEDGGNEEEGKRQRKAKEVLVRESGAGMVVWDCECLASRVEIPIGYHKPEEEEMRDEGGDKEKKRKEHPSSSSSSSEQEQQQQQQKSDLGPLFDKVLHLASQTTIGDSLKSVKRGGTVCFVPTRPSLPSSNSSSPNILTTADVTDLIPSETRLTVYRVTVDQFLNTPFQALVNQVETGKMKVHVGRAFGIDEVGEAWRCLMNEEGKVVVLV